MSEDGNGNSLNLRGFRIQKKPTLSYTPVHDGSEDALADMKVEIKTENIPLPDIDSEYEIKANLSDDCEIIETNEDKKTIISVLSPGMINSTLPTTNNQKSGTTQKPNDATQVISSLYITSRPKKSEAVLEKEKQMRFLRERYPSMESMAIHDVLSRHTFDINKAVEELELKVKDKRRGNTQDYASWKASLDKKDSSKTIDTPRIVTTQTTSTVSQQPTRKRIIVEGFSDATKNKAKRLRTESISDDSDVEATEYKDNNCVFNGDDSDVEVSNELISDKKKVLEFFQSATANELQLMSSCSRRKVEAIIVLRPFENWSDLEKKLSDNKYLSADLLNAAQDVLRTRNSVQQLMKKCRSIAERMEEAVAAGAEVIKQPGLLDASRHLTTYQMIGLNWLAVLHAQGLNGILADEMGLGKTIQVIAFLAHLKETGATKGIPHLIVVPSSTLDNWRVEFERWCPEMKVFMYYGTIEERKMYRIEYWSKGNIANYDVILTTYSMVTNGSEEKKMFKVTQMHYVIFDEAHMLKNMNTQRYETLIQIKALNRILLTGTPLQNNLLELMSLLIFVMPTIFAGKTDDLKSLFSRNARTKAEEDNLPPFEKNQIKHAKDIMKPFVLRRLKRDVLQDLPEKTDEVVKVPLAPTQLEQYENLVCHFQNVGKEASEYGTYSAMTMMTDLRKLSNHPLLLKYFYQYDDLAEMARLLSTDPTYKGTVVEYILEDLGCNSDYDIHSLCKQHKCLKKFELPDNLILTSGKFLYLDKKLKELKEAGHRVLIFSQYVIMLNIMEEYLQLRNHSYLRLDGTTPVTTRQELIDQYTSDPSIFIFLLSTKAGGLGINLTAADTVIIHDIDFNPYNDKQAEDRCHRIGQTKPVSVFRLISHCTIEEGMWQMNQEKLKLEKEVTANEAEDQDVKSVVRLLSSVLGVDSTKVTNLIQQSQVATTQDKKKS